MVGFLSTAVTLESAAVAGIIVASQRESHRPSTGIAERACPCRTRRRDVSEPAPDDPRTPNTEKHLTPEQYHVTRERGTETAFHRQVLEP